MQSTPNKWGAGKTPHKKDSTPYIFSVKSTTRAGTNTSCAYFLRLFFFFGGELNKTNLILDQDSFFIPLFIIRQTGNVMQIKKNMAASRRPCSTKEWRNSVALDNFLLLFLGQLIMLLAVTNFAILLQTNKNIDTNLRQMASL